MVSMMKGMHSCSPALGRPPCCPYDSAPEEISCAVKPTLLAPTDTTAMLFGRCGEGEVHRRTRCANDSAGTNFLQGFPRLLRLDPSVNLSSSWLDHVKALSQRQIVNSILCSKAGQTEGALSQLSLPASRWSNLLLLGAEVPTSALCKITISFHIAKKSIEPVSRRYALLSSDVLRSRGLSVSLHDRCSKVALQVLCWSESVSKGCQ